MADPPIGFSSISTPDGYPPRTVREAVGSPLIEGSNTLAEWVVPREDGAFRVEHEPGCLHLLANRGRVDPMQRLSIARTCAWMFLLAAAALVAGALVCSAVSTHGSRADAVVLALVAGTTAVMGTH